MGVPEAHAAARASKSEAVQESPMSLLKLIFVAPGNALADALGTTDEHERGLLRMLVNSVIWISLGAVMFMIAVMSR